ncbi:Nuclear transport factor 2 [Hirschfeldia incana]|nr:Nuclear transport factor 2 [Hirschfeldia incana]
MVSSSLSFHSLAAATVNPIYSGDAVRSTFRRQFGVSCRGQSPSTNEPQTTSKGERGEPENVLLKIAWYGSELLGIAASAFRSPASLPPPNTTTDQDFEIPVDCSGRAVRVAVVDSIKHDFKRSYFVTGDLTPAVYEEKCEFADPAGSFKGLTRFKRNCSNFGSLIEKSNMKLMKWENFEEKGVGHWKFSCVMSFPWKPILSATGYTEYYFDPESGKVCRHVEHWNVPKIALFKQLLRPSRGLLGTSQN